MSRPAVQPGPASRGLALVGGALRARGGISGVQFLHMLQGALLSSKISSLEVTYHPLYNLVTCPHCQPGTLLSVGSRLPSPLSECAPRPGQGLWGPCAPLPVYLVPEAVSIRVA